MFLGLNLGCIRLYSQSAQQERLETDFQTVNACIRSNVRDILFDSHHQSPITQLLYVVLNAFGSAIEIKDCFGIIHILSARKNLTFSTDAFEQIAALENLALHSKSPILDAKFSSAESILSKKIPGF